MRNQTNNELYASSKDLGYHNHGSGADVERSTRSGLERLKLEAVCLSEIVCVYVVATARTVTFRPVAAKVEQLVLPT